MGLADLHMHTIYSYDGTASVPAVLRCAKQPGLDVIASTDHFQNIGKPDCKLDFIGNKFLVIAPAASFCGQLEDYANYKR